MQISITRIKVRALSGCCRAQGSGTLPGVLKSVRVPPGFEPPFRAAEEYVERLFKQLSCEPARGTIHVGEDRYVLMRAESLYLAWYEAMAEALGEEAAYEFIYNTARAIGRSDARTFAQRMGVSSSLERLSAGPVHFAHAGWALVDIFEDSQPSPDNEYYLHYCHPNTFESEVLGSLGRRLPSPGCFFSAGYSSGWCSFAYGIEVHGREVQCVAAGGEACEFIMGRSERLAEWETRATACCRVPAAP